MTSSALPDPWVRPAHAAAPAGAPGTGGLVDTARPGGHRPAGLADRPLQPALHLLHAARGPGLAAQGRGAHRRGDRPAGPDRRRAARHPRGPVHRRRAAAAPRPGRASSPPPPRCAPRPEVSLTTNAIGLSRVAPALAAAGLDRINVSLDTLDPARFKQLTHRDRLDDVLAGLAAAQAAGLTPVKVNAVLLHGHQRGRRRPAARLLPRARLPAALHRADAAGRPPRLDPRPRWSPPRTSSSGCPPPTRSRPTPRSAAPRRPSAGWSTAARRPSASSPR